MVRSPARPATVTCAPSAISTGGRSMCGSACARWPPTVATLRTRTFDSVRNVRVITGACARTAAECSTIASGVMAPILSAPSSPDSIARQRRDIAQADQPRRLEHARLHHQHQRGAAGDRTHRGIVGIEQRDRLAQRSRLRKLERRHGAAPAGLAWNAALMRAANCFSISLAFDRSTGWPRLPSLPVSAASTS